MASGTRRPLKRPSAFWDASALVPLYVTQQSTREVSALYQAYDVVVWWTTPVEIASAFARLLRMNYLDVSTWRQSLDEVLDEAQEWSVLPPTAAIRGKAIEVVGRYDLRAADALQLAAALEWCNEQPPGHKFITTDKKLRDAAMLCGFDTLT